METKNIILELRTKNPFFFVYCGIKFVLRKALTFGADRVTIQTTKNTSDAAESCIRGVLLDHSLSHRHARSTRKQWNNCGQRVQLISIFCSRKH